MIENQTFDMERALYGSKGVVVRNCSFDGPADGESAFKEGQHCGIPTILRSLIQRCMELRHFVNVVML